MALVTGAGKGVEGVEGTRARVESLGRRCLDRQRAFFEPLETMAEAALALCTADPAVQLEGPR